MTGRYRATWTVTIGTACLAALVTGMVVPVAVTAQAPGASPEVTFTKDIAPILQRSCQNCHRPDGVAPMPLTTYEEVRPWARAIKQRTGLGPRAGVMPPWYVEKNIGIQHYKDDPSLSEEELAKVAKWADSGAPRGNPADMPPPIKWADGGEWRIGKPDLVVSTKELLVKGDAPDWWGEIESVPLGLTEDRYVAAVEIREVNDVPKSGTGRETVGGKYVFHHMIWSTRVLSDVPENAELTLELVLSNPDAVTPWPVHEVGRNPDVFDELSGRLLKAGSSIVSDSVHLHSNGRDTKAQARGRLQVPSQGLRAEASSFAHAPVRQRRRHRHQADGGQSATPRLHGAAGAHQAHLVRTAPPCTGRAHVHRSDLGIQHPDAHLRRLRSQLGSRLRLRRRPRAVAAQGNHPAHHRLHGQLAEQQERSRSAQLAGLRQPVGGQHVHRPRHGPVAHRRAVRSRDGQASREDEADAAGCDDRLPVVQRASSSAHSHDEHYVVAIRQHEAAAAMTRRLGLSTGLLLVCAVVLTHAQSYSSGQNASPAFEGWEKNSDGSFNFLFGYMNRNWEEELNVPIGPDNNIEPGGPDQGQPTRLLPRRNRFVFRVRVPADWGKQELIWTLTTKGKTEKAYASLKQDYFIDDVVIASETGALGAGTSSPEIRANKRPEVKLDGDKTRWVKVGEPLTLVAWVADDGVPKGRAGGVGSAPRPSANVTPAVPRNPAFTPPSRITVGKRVGLHLSWFVYRGDGGVRFDPAQVKVWEETRAGANSPWAPLWVPPPVPPEGRYEARATFDRPGTYVLRARADDGALFGDADLTVTVTQ